MFKRKNRLFLVVLAVMLVAVSITGVTFSQLTPRKDGGKAAELALLRLNANGRTDCSKLRPGEAAETGIAFQNRGEAPCYLRVKLCVPEFGEREVLQPGMLAQGAFQPLEGTSEKNGEYWTRDGEYICYKNSKTGDLLLPGKETAALYSAVRFNPELQAELLPKGMSYEIHVIAETAEALDAAEQRDWKTQELEN